MLAPGHIVVGLLTCQTLITFFTGQPPGPALLAVAALGSLMPDIDHDKSWVGRRLCPPLTRVLNRFLGHRGFTHSFVAVLALMMLLFSTTEKLSISWLNGYLAAFCLGYLSHLMADFFTHAGIPLLWPFLNHRFPRPNLRIPFIHFKTGGQVEYTLTFFGVVCLAWLWVY